MADVNAGLSARRKSCLNQTIDGGVLAIFIDGFDDVF